MTVGKTAGELAVLAMEQLGDNAACKDLIGVTVHPTAVAGPGTNWEIAVSLREGTPVSSDCNIAVIAVEVALQGEYHLIAE